MPRRLLPIFLLAGALALPAQAQLVPLAEGGARALALGRAGVALRGDVWGLYNPAAWGTLERGSAGLFASQAFGLSELRVGAVAVAQPTRWATVAGTARTYGFEDFRETVVGLGAARALALSPSRRLHAGLAVRYTSVTIPEYGTGGAVGLSGGLLVEVLPGLTFGAHAQNVNRPKLTDFDPLQTRLDVGVAYRAHPRALVLAAVTDDVDFPAAFCGGLEVRPVDVLFLRAGVMTAPTRFSAGVGVALGRLRADVAAERHDVLGWTPAFEFGVSW